MSLPCAVFGGPNHRSSPSSLIYQTKMAWYKNNAFCFGKIHHQQHKLVVLVIMRHSVTDSLILRPEETIRSSTLTSSELPASKFHLQILVLIPLDSSAIKALSQHETHEHTTISFFFPPKAAHLHFHKCQTLTSTLCFWFCSLCLLSHPIFPSCEGHQPE